MAALFIRKKKLLLETTNLNDRKNKIAEILSTYTYDIYDNNTLQ